MAYLGDMIDRNPMDKVERPKPRKDEIKADGPLAYTPAEIQQIITSLEREPLKWQALIHLLIDTGIRRGECCALQWKSIDFESGAITIAGNLCYTSAFVRNKWQTAVEKGAAEMRRTVLDHVAGRFRLAGLEIARFQPRESEHLGRILELGEITVLREDDGGGRSPDAWDGEHGRVNTTDTFFNLVIQFLHLGVQLCVKLQQDGHFLEKEVSRTANRVFCQGLEFDKVIQREMAP